MKPPPLHRYLLELYIFLFVLLLCSRCCVQADGLESLRDTCSKECGNSYLAVPLPGDSNQWNRNYFSSCNFDCHVNQCTSGCSKPDPISESVMDDADLCRMKCGFHQQDILQSSSSSCYQGCYFLLEMFNRVISDLLMSVQLQARNETRPLALNLKWTFAKFATGSPHLWRSVFETQQIAWFIQGREISTSSTWRLIYLQPLVQHDSKFDIRVTSLQTELLKPATQYEFRLLAVVNNLKLLVSKSHRVTSGSSESWTPSSAPLITHQIWVTDTQKILCWTGPNPQSEILSYDVELSQGIYTDAKVSGSRCNAFSHLNAELTYVARIAGKSYGGTGLSTETSVAPPAAAAAGSGTVLLITKQKVFQLVDPSDPLLSHDPIMVYDAASESGSAQNAQITAIAPAGDSTVFVGFDSGLMRKVHLRHEASESLHSASGFYSPILDMETDHWNKKLFLLLHNGVYVCEFVECPTGFKLIQGRNIKDIAVDAWNGYIYWLTNSELLRASLPHYESRSLLPQSAHQPLAQLDATAIAIDRSSASLLIAMQNQSIITYDFVAGVFSDQRQSLVQGRGSHAHVTRMAASREGSLFWISSDCRQTEFCLFSETLLLSRRRVGLGHPNISINEIPLPPSASNPTDLTWIDDDFFSRELPAPKNVQILSAARSVRLWWDGIQHYPFQNELEWRRLSYNLNLNTVARSVHPPRLVQGIVNISNSYIVRDLLPSTEYAAELQVCLAFFPDKCSSSVEVATTTFAEIENGDTTKINFLDANGYAYTLGLTGETLRKGENLLNAVHSDKEDVSCFDIDIYTTNGYFCNDTGVYRVAAGSVVMLVAQRGVKWIAIVSSRALLITAQPYRILGFRLTGTFFNQYYACNARHSSECQEVVGLRAEEDRIVYLTQSHDGFISSHLVDFTNNSWDVTAQVHNFPRINSMREIGSKLAIISSEGILGICDKSLSNVAWYPAIQGITPRFLLQKVPPLSRSLSNITSVEISTRSYGELWLSWQHEQFPNESLLYAASGESRSSTFYEILDSSARKVRLPQRFAGDSIDVRIQVFSAWTSAAAHKHLLTSFTPVRNLRFYLTHLKWPQEESLVSVQLAWEVDPTWPMEPFGYRISCEQQGNRTYFIMPMTDDPLFSFGYLTKDIPITCSVAPIKSASDLGVPMNVSSNTKDVVPYVRLVDSGSKGLAVYEEDTQTLVGHRTGIYGPSAAINNTVFLVVTEASRDTLMWADIDHISDASLKRMDVRFEAGDRQIVDLTADWVGRRLFVAVSQTADSVVLKRLQLPDDLRSSRHTIEPVVLNRLVQNFGQMVFDPIRDTLYYTANGQLISMVQSSVPRNKRQTESSVRLEPACLRGKGATGGLTAQYTPGKRRSPSLLFASDDGITRFDPATHICSTEVGLDTLTRSGIAPQDVTRLSVGFEKLYIFGKGNATAAINLAQPKTVLPVTYGRDGYLLACSPQFQPYPSIYCLELFGSPKDFVLEPVGNTGLKIRIPKPPVEDSCLGLAQPLVTYSAYVRDWDSVRGLENVCVLPDCRLHQDTSAEMLISDLRPHAKYKVRMAWSNRFSGHIALSAPKAFQASVGYPTQPTGVQALPLAPDQALILWTFPQIPAGELATLRYSVYQRRNAVPSASAILRPDDLTDRSKIKCIKTPCEAMATQLKADTKYAFQVNVSQANVPEHKAASGWAQMRTFGKPGTLAEKRENRTSNSTVLRWTPTDPTPNTLVRIRYSQAGNPSYQWLFANKEPFPAEKETDISLKNLAARTAYIYGYAAEFHLHYTYDGLNYTRSHAYTFEDLQVWSFTTLASRPPRPASLVLGSKDDDFQVSWTFPETAETDDVKEYRLEYRVSPDSKWNVADDHVNPTATSWNPKYLNLQVNESFEFRLAARNTDGVLGAFLSTADVQVQKDEGGIPRVAIILVVIALVGLMVVACAILLVALRRKKQKPPSPVYPLAPPDPWTSPETMDPLRSVSAEELQALPHVPRSSVTIARLLGKGAFGEVYEGLACNLPRIGPKSLRVAIKTLRPGSSDDDRVKFLKEAIMMSNFNHRNVVNMLGVCLDSEPHWIIAELMEGGDLLSYLRSARPSHDMSSQVSLRDLMSISTDVCQGCEYLEQNHNVHRDLAARNCLVTTRNPQLRVVKIADFGLTRDIYTDDYYRVEGQGLLPIRWMAPESMIDGVFTQKTDVWSFGVLLWEVMTLGHQPYPGRSNWDVMNFVRIGGRLQKPDYCPENIYNMMLECWCSRPGERPSFRELADRLDGMKRLATDAPFPPAIVLAPPDYTSSSGQRGSSEQRGSDGKVNISVTQNSAHFHRNNLTQSLKPDFLATRKRKTLNFRSLRRQKAKHAPAPMPPSKDKLNFTVGGSVSSPIYEEPKTRPISGFSSGAESYTTSTEGYEVPLIKGVTNLARHQLLMDEEAAAQNRLGVQGLSNPAFSPEKDMPVASGFGSRVLPEKPIKPPYISDSSMDRMHRFNTRYVSEPSGSGTGTEEQKAPSEPRTFEAANARVVRAKRPQHAPPPPLNYAQLSPNTESHRQSASSETYLIPPVRAEPKDNPIYESRSETSV